MRYFTTTNHVADDSFVSQQLHREASLHHAYNAVKLLELELATSLLSTMDPPQQQTRLI